MRQAFRGLGWPIVGLVIGCGSIVYLSAIGFEPTATWMIGIVLGLLVLIAWAIWEGVVVETATRKVNVGRAIFLATPILGMLTLYTQWPLRTGFTAVRGELDRIADKIERGETVATPLRVGTFLIQRAEMRYGNYPALMLDTESSGPTSLVRMKNFPSEGWSKVQLTDDWLLFSED